MTEVPADLLARIQGREASALAAIVRDHARPIYRAARGMGFRDDEAEDLTQDVFTTFMQTLDHFQGRSQIRTWLFGILHHKVQERRRAVAHDALNDPIDENFDARFDANGSWIQPPVDLERLVASREMGQAIHGCLGALPDSQRDVFVLREIEELDTQAICKILGRTVTHVGVLFHRARVRLRACLEQQGWRQQT